MSSSPERIQALRAQIRPLVRAKPLYPKLTAFRNDIFQQLDSLVSRKRYNWPHINGYSRLNVKHALAFRLAMDLYNEGGIQMDVQPGTSGQMLVVAPTTPATMPVVMPAMSSTMPIVTPATMPTVTPATILATTPATTPATMTPMTLRSHVLPSESTRDIPGAGSTGDIQGDEGDYGPPITPSDLDAMHGLGDDDLSGVYVPASTQQSSMHTSSPSKRPTTEKVFIQETSPSILKDGLGSIISMDLMAAAPANARRADPSIPYRAAAPVLEAAAALPVAVPEPEAWLVAVAVAVVFMPELAGAAVLIDDPVALALPPESRFAPSTTVAVANVTSLLDKTAVTGPLVSSFPPDWFTVQVISTAWEL
ncbi:hypothetical protein N0V83_001927 [Neocucurbitaria cava]|uniref:Uncharacterized protein n=1 Tax=Neocucurbitaria cava TaxID=798079 RepID=A0A9W8YDK7_9PLEO|nr:hypothetical protein N0V83_001927 [Neocucurbitaria cava]